MMRRVAFKVLLITAVIGTSFLSLVACGKKEDRPQLGGVAIPGGHPTIGVHDALPEKLAGSLKQNQSSTHAEACERPHYKVAEQIVKILDAKSEDIAKFAQEHAPKTTERAVGSMKFVASEAPKVVEAGWKEHAVSWQSAAELFEKIKADKEVSADWVKLRDEVRQLVANDRRRLVQGHNLSLTKDSEKSLSKAIEAAKACAESAGCDRPELDAETERFLLGNPVYAPIVNRMDSARTNNGKRAEVQHLHTRLKYDHQQQFEFLKKHSIKRKGKELVVKVNPGKAPEEIKALIEELWKSDSLSVKVEFDRTDTTAIKLELGAITLVDSYSTLRLADGTDTRQLAHEVGHLLGFRDRRFAVWTAAACTYTLQTRADDLMSVYETGSILAEDWEALKKAYPES